MSDKYQQALKEAYAQARSDVHIWDTLEISHPAYTTTRTELEVCFVLNTKTSMSGQIGDVQTVASALNTSLEVTFDDVRYSLITFEGDDFPIIEEAFVDFPTFQSALNLVSTVVSDNPTGQEVFTALSIAINNINWSESSDVSRVIVFLTDAEDNGGSTSTIPEIRLDLKRARISLSYGPSVLTSLEALRIPSDGTVVADFSTVEPLATILKTPLFAEGEDSLFMVLDVVDRTFTLEDSTERTFMAAGFRILPPAESSEGLQELTIEIDNVDRRVGEFVRAVKRFNEPARVVYRNYISTDLTGPQNIPPLVLNLKDIKLTSETASGRATFFDLINAKFLNQYYTRRRYASLGNT